MNFPDLSLDLRTFIRTATFVALFFAVYSIWRGWRAIRSSGNLPYFRLRQQRLLSGWRLVRCINFKETRPRVWPIEGGTHGS